MEQSRNNRNNKKEIEKFSPKKIPNAKSKATTKKEEEKNKNKMKHDQVKRFSDSAIQRLA